MNLPESQNIDVQPLNLVFKDTTNSYKFYWFKSLLFYSSRNLEIINIDDVIIRMIAEVWHPINTYNLSFGKQDLFTISITELKKEFNLDEKYQTDELFNALDSQKTSIIIKSILSKLKRWVPERFIRPWFTESLKGLQDSQVNKKIRFLSSQLPSSLYSFLPNDKIQLNKEWIGFLNNNLNILESYINWHLLKFLEKRNPNCPNISAKIKPSSVRNMTNSKKLWNSFFKINKCITCIYSGEEVNETNLSLDHFLPWSYVCHDFIWNLTPTLVHVNSSKGNNLPHQSYLKNFCKIQFDCFNHLTFYKEAHASNIEEYLILFGCSFEELKNIELQVFDKKIISTLEPHITIASNMGFNTNWQFLNK